MCFTVCVQASPQSWQCPPSSLVSQPPCRRCLMSRPWTYTCGQASSLFSCLSLSTPPSTISPQWRKWRSSKGQRCSNVFLNIIWKDFLPTWINSPLWPLLVQIPNSYNATEAMVLDGCFHDNEIDLTSFLDVSSTPVTERNTQARNSTVSANTEGTRLRRKHPVKQHLSFIMSNSYMIDSCSRVIFPLAYLLFNIIYWSLYS